MNSCPPLDRLSFAGVPGRACDHQQRHVLRVRGRVAACAVRPRQVQQHDVDAALVFAPGQGTLIRVTLPRRG
jgi:hypothetical protein